MQGISLGTLHGGLLLDGGTFTKNNGDPLATNPVRPRRDPVPSDAMLRNIPDIDTPPQVNVSSSSPATMLLQEPGVSAREMINMLDTVAQVHAISTGPDGKPTPTTLAQALVLPEREAKLWLSAWESERASHLKNGTFGPLIDPASLPHVSNHFPLASSLRSNVMVATRCVLLQKVFVCGLG